MRSTLKTTGEKMNLNSFDTLEYLNDLKDSGVDQLQAEGMTRATAKAFAQALELKEIATKSDFKQLEAVLKKEMADNKLELIKYVTDTKIELTKHVTESRTELTKYIHDTRSELTKYVTEIRSELIKYVHDTTWKMIGILIGFQTLLLGAFGILQYFFKPAG